MAIVFARALAVVVAALVVAVAVGEWWILPVALVGNLAGIAAVLAVARRRRALEDRDKPDPVTAARLEDEGAVEESSNGSRRPDAQRR